MIVRLGVRAARPCSAAWMPVAESVYDSPTIPEYRLLEATWLTAVTVDFNTGVVGLGEKTWPHRRRASLSHEKSRTGTVG